MNILWITVKQHPADEKNSRKRVCKGILEGEKQPPAHHFRLQPTGFLKIQALIFHQTVNNFSDFIPRNCRCGKCPQESNSMSTDISTILSTTVKLSTNRQQYYQQYGFCQKESSEWVCGLLSSGLWNCVKAAAQWKKAGRRPARDKDCIFISVCRSAPR